MVSQIITFMVKILLPLWLVIYNSYSWFLLHLWEPTASWPDSYKFLLFFIIHNENCWVFQKFCHLQYKKDETWFEISHVYSISYPYSNPKMFSLK